MHCLSESGDFPHCAHAWGGADADEVADSGCAFGDCDDEADDSACVVDATFELFVESAIFEIE